MKKDFDGRKYLREAAETARDLRAASRRFLGFEGSMTAIQAKMLADFNASASIAHSGDKGTARENVLRDFLRGPYLPKRYGVADNPSAVVATTGAVSEQIDITIFDALDAPRLLDIGEIQYFPVESVLGVIQVKSNLSTTREITDGLSNIASFKRLRCEGYDAPLGFGVLFAYTASLQWSTIVEAITEWEREHPSTCWPNLVCVMDQGGLLNVAGPRTTVHNAELHTITEPKLMAIISDGAELVNFYLLLLDILAQTSLPRIPHWSYANLPMWVDGHSVRFTFGPYTQVAECPKHGPYLKDLRAGAADVIAAGCAGRPKINEFSLSGEFASGPVGPPNVYLFDPESHGRPVVEFVDALIFPGGQARVVDGGIGVEAIEIDGEVYFVPYYYDTKLALVKHCPKCPERVPDPDITLENWRAYLRHRAEKRRQQLTKENDEAAMTDANQEVTDR